MNMKRLLIRIIGIFLVAISVSTFCNFYDYILNNPLIHVGMWFAVWLSIEVYSYGERGDTTGRFNRAREY